MGEQVLQIFLIAVRLFYQTEIGEVSSEFVLLKSWRREFGADDNLNHSGSGCDAVWFLWNGLG